MGSYILPVIVWVFKVAFPFYLKGRKWGALLKGRWSVHVDRSSGKNFL